MITKIHLYPFVMSLLFLFSSDASAQNRLGVRPAVLDDPASANIDYLPGENPAFRKLCWPIYSEAGQAVQSAKDSVQSKPQKIRQSLFTKARDRNLAELCKKYKILPAHLKFVMTAGDSWHWRNGDEQKERKVPDPGDYRKAIEWEYTYFQYDQSILIKEVSALKAQQVAAVSPRPGTTMSLEAFSASTQRTLSAQAVEIPVGPCGYASFEGRVCKRPTAGGKRCYKHRNN